MTDKEKLVELAERKLTSARKIEGASPLKERYIQQAIKLRYAASWLTALDKPE